MRLSDLRTSGLIATAVAVALGASACGEATVRSTARFCGELTAHANEIQTVPSKADEVPALITLYSKMGEVAPLEIEGDWEKVYGSLKTANTVTAESASVKTATDSAYAASQSAVNVVTWAKANCNVDIGPVAIVPGGATIESSPSSTVTGG